MLIVWLIVNCTRSAHNPEQNNGGKTLPERKRNMYNGGHIPVRHIQKNFI